MARERDTTDLPRRMSEHEALMWTVEKDPWLNPSGASTTLLDRPVDMERFRRQLRAAIAKTPRLYQRVAPGFGRVLTPAWVPDAEFDLDAHLREVVLPAPGTDRQLLDLVAQFYSEPFDRTRPLWRFVTISGLAGGRGAIYAIIHHSVSDGIGQLRMAELYQQLTRDEDAPPEIDLEGIIAKAVQESGAHAVGGAPAMDVIANVRESSAHLLRRQLGIGRRVAGEVAMWPADPHRATDKLGTVVDTVRSALSMLAPGDGEQASASPLWKGRSRHRHLEWVRLEVADLKATGTACNATVNDVFLAGLADAAHRYHAVRGVEIATINSSFVLSTRHDNKASGNAFTPVPVRLPAGDLPPRERLAAVVEALATAKEGAQKTGGMTGLSGIINLLPTSLITQTGRSAAAHIDFATSNLRGAGFTLYCSGARVEATICMGPVAGTGANITGISMDGHFDIGIFLDPAAITEPKAFRDDVAAAFADLFAAARPKVARPKPTRTKSTRPKRTARASSAQSRLSS